MINASTIRIAWRNLGRNRRRTGLAVLAIGIGQFALLATSGLMHGYADNIRLAITGPMVGHVQVHAPGWREERAMDLAIDDVQELLPILRARPEVENAGARIYAPVLVAPRKDAFTGVVVGVEAAVESGEYGLLSGLAEPLLPKHVLIGHILAQRTGASPGMEIALVGQAMDGSIANDLYTVQAIIRSPAALVNQSGIVMQLSDAQTLFALPGRAHEIVIRNRRAGTAEALAADLQREEAFKHLEVRPWRALVPELVVVMRMTDSTGYFIIIIVFIAAIAGITNTLMMATFERLHEFGMLLALGARPRRILALIIAEALLLGILGILLGTALGYGFAILTASGGIDLASWGGDALNDMTFKGLNLPLQIRPRIAWIDPFFGAASVLFTALLASLWPAAIAARLDPIKAMHA